MATTALPLLVLNACALTFLVMALLLVMSTLAGFDLGRQRGRMEGRAEVLRDLRLKSGQPEKGDRL